MHILHMSSKILSLSRKYLKRYISKHFFTNFLLPVSIYLASVNTVFEHKGS